MTRRSMILVLGLLGHAWSGFADPSSAPAPFVLGPKASASPKAAPSPKPSPRSASASRATTPPVTVRFAPPLDAWTMRTVATSRLTLELTSTGPSRLTTLTARRVLLTREEVARTRKGLTRTTTLRSVTASRNGEPELRPAETALIGHALGVRLSGGGKITGVVGLTAARDSVADRPQADLLAENQATSAQLAGATPEDEGLKDAWEADAGRYLGKRLANGDVLFFSERLRLPFLPRHSLPFFSEQRVVGPVVVNGRPGVALDITCFSMAMSEVASGVSPTTGPDSAFAAWARKSRARLSFPETRIRGAGRRVISVDGRGLLEQDMAMDVTLTGALAVEAAGDAKPLAKSLQVRLERQQRMLSGPPELSRQRAAAVTRPSARSAPARGESRTEEPAEEE